MPFSSGSGDAKMPDSDEFVGALDIGTSSVRFLVYGVSDFKKVSGHQIELEQFFPNPGWVEQDPDEILQKSWKCMQIACDSFVKTGHNKSSIKGIGISNQRESTIVWDKHTGKALHRSIVWSDIRTVETVNKLLQRLPEKNPFHFQTKCGLPLATYFSALKLRWILDHSEVARKAYETDALLFGTVDSWVVWNLTGGAGGGGHHVTDCTNASRTFLMNLTTCDWDDELIEFFGVSRSILPDIKSSSEVYAAVVPPSQGVLEQLRGVPIASIMGDQQAALVGNRCFSPGQAKNTYGTGCFLLQNIGDKLIFSNSGLLTTIAYKFGPKARPVYALEGSIAVVGSALRWLRDKLHLVQQYDEVDTLAAEAGPDTRGVYFVPAFTGLFAPHWDSQARGMIIGLTQSSDASHIARAALEAGCFQTRELLEAMQADLMGLKTKAENSGAGGEDGRLIKPLIADGGLTKSKLMMQFQADILGTQVRVSKDAEMTCRGAAFAAALALSLIGRERLMMPSDEDNEPVPNDVSGEHQTVYNPTASEEERLEKYSRWLEAVGRCQRWARE